MTMTGMKKTTARIVTDTSCRRLSSFSTRRGLCLSGLYVDELASLLALGEYYYTVDESEDGVVLTHTHVETGMVNGATLTLDDVTGFAMLTAENLYSESFAF